MNWHFTRGAKINSSLHFPPMIAGGFVTSPGFAGAGYLFSGLYIRLPEYIYDGHKVY